MKKILEKIYPKLYKENKDLKNQIKLLEIQLNVSNRNFFNRPKLYDLYNDLNIEKEEIDFTKYFAEDEAEEIKRITKKDVFKLAIKLHEYSLKEQMSTGTASDFTKLQFTLNGLYLFLDLLDDIGSTYDEDKPKIIGY